MIIIIIIIFSHQGLLTWEKYEVLMSSTKTFLSYEVGLAWGD